MALMDDLVEAYLQQFDEFMFVLDKKLGLVFVETVSEDTPLSWSSEESANLVAIPTITKAESTRLMQDFASKQPDDKEESLQKALEQEDRFLSFEKQVEEFGLENEWEQFERDNAKKYVQDWLKLLQLDYNELNEKHAIHAADE
jgi:CRISPR/Cas system CSM-associated protein Csm5 (group 7 of RAMP superfamily)